MRPSGWCSTQPWSGGRRGLRRRERLRLRLRLRGSLRLRFRFAASFGFGFGFDLGEPRLRLRRRLGCGLRAAPPSVSSRHPSASGPHLGDGSSRAALDLRRLLARRLVGLACEPLGLRHGLLRGVERPRGRLLLLVPCHRPTPDRAVSREATVRRHRTAATFADHGGDDDAAVCSAKTTGCRTRMPRAAPVGEGNAMGRFVRASVAAAVTAWLRRPRRVRPAPAARAVQRRGDGDRGDRHDQLVDTSGSVAVRGTEGATEVTLQRTLSYRGDRPADERMRCRATARAARLRPPLLGRVHGRRAGGCRRSRATSNGAFKLSDVARSTCRPATGASSSMRSQAATSPSVRRSHHRPRPERGRGARHDVERLASTCSSESPDVEARTRTAPSTWPCRRTPSGLHRDLERAHRHGMRTRSDGRFALDLHTSNGSITVTRTARSDCPRSSSSTASSCVDGPVEVGRLHHDRRCEADGRTVRVLREHAATHERLAHLAPGRDRGIDVDAGPEPGAAHLDDAVADERREAVVQARRRAHAPAPAARRSRACARPRGRPRRRAGCRRRSSRARPARSTPSTSRSPTTADTGTMPPPSALPSRYRSGTTPDELAREGRADTAEARLDLVGDEQHVPLAGRARAATAGSRQAARGCRPRPGSARRARRRCSRRWPPRPLRRRRTGTIRNPGVYGPKSSRASGSSLNEMIVVVRPWKLPAITMMFAASGATPFTR